LRASAVMRDLSFGGSLTDVVSLGIVDCNSPVSLKYHRPITCRNPAP
jgi:hypothetical protein